MKKVLIISNYWHFPFEKTSSRYNSIVEMFSNRDDLDVELVTSNFRHIIKTKRNYNKEMFKNLKYKVTFIDEPGYKKNISLKRIISHRIFSKNLKKYLESLNNVDAIYSFCPSLSANTIIADYCQKNNIKYIIDILDLWPEAFKMVFKVPIVSNIIFAPLTAKANYIYSQADYIVAVSNSYLKRALKENKKGSKGSSVYIGVDLEYFDECKEKYKKTFDDDYIRIAYIGTLGHSYDIRIIIDAIKLLEEKGINNIKFIVMGDGPLKECFEQYANEKNINCEFTGRLDYPEMIGTLCSCDIGVNPIVHGAAQSIINKVADYASAGLPVINTQECEEYRSLIEKYSAGINCENSNPNNIANNIELLIKDEKMRHELGEGNRKMALELFDRNKTYIEIQKIIERI